MLLWFDKNGVLKEMLTYGAPARVGTTNFKIFAYFEGLDTSVYGSAVIRFERPDMQGSEYPTLFMKKVDVTYDPQIASSSYFTLGGGPNVDGTYPCYMFDFNNVFDSENPDNRLILLDTPGLWKTSIVLINSNSYTKNVLGRISFNVEGSVSEEDDDPTELTYSVIAANIASAIATKLNMDSTYYIREHNNLFQASTAGTLPAAVFVVGSCVFDKETNALYVINAVEAGAGEGQVRITNYAEIIDFDNFEVDEKPTIGSVKPVSSNGVAQEFADVVANEFEAGTTYNIGDYCIYENKLYMSTNTQVEVESFDPDKWRLTNVIGGFRGLEDQISAKQNRLVSGVNIKTVGGDSLLGSGNVPIDTFKPFSQNWVNTSTTAAFCALVNADPDAYIGTAFLGELYCSDLPFNGNADAVVEIIEGTGTSGKVIHIVITSGNIAPYRWEYTYWNNGANTSGWIGFQPELPAGNNDTYLHKNASTGNLEWVNVEAGGNNNLFVITVQDTSALDGSLNIITSAQTIYETLSESLEDTTVAIKVLNVDNSVQGFYIASVNPGDDAYTIYTSNTILADTGGFSTELIESIMIAVEVDQGVYSATGIHNSTIKNLTDFVVGVTYSNSTYTIDKTYADFSALLQTVNGKSTQKVAALYMGIYYILATQHDFSWVFSYSNPATGKTRFLTITWSNSTPRTYTVSEAETDFVSQSDLANYVTQQDLTNYVTLNTAQAITGTKTFTDFDVKVSSDTSKIAHFTNVENYYLAIKMNNDNALLFDFAGNSVNATNLLPLSTNARNLGSASAKWKDLYLSGSLRDGNNANYGLKLPDTTSYTADKTIATTADLTTKQDTLTFDSAPTAGSTNPVTSAGIKTAIDNAVSNAYIYKGSKTVIEINALNTSDLTAGWIYNVSTSGTITLGNISVVAGDNVAWTGTEWDKMAGSFAVSKATSSSLGTVKLGSDTVQNEAANNVSQVYARSYAIQLNSSDQMVVNVPWTDTTYVLATAATAGLVKSSTTGTTTDRDYAVEVNNDGTMKVNVPWTNTTYATANNTVAGLVMPLYITTGSATSSGTSTYSDSPTVNARTNTADRFYGVEVDTSGHMYVNVPWTTPSDYVNLSTAQTVGGVKTFTGQCQFTNQYGINIAALSALNGVQLASLSPSAFSPYSNNTKSLGTTSLNWKNLYLSGAINPNSNGYGLLLPDTSLWTANKTIATTQDVNANIAPTYDATASYSVNAFAIYNGTLYKCNTVISGGEAWNSSHWDAVLVGNELNAKQLALTTTSVIDGTINSNKVIGFNQYGTLVKGYVTTANISSAGASSGQVLTADGSNGVSWSSITVPTITLNGSATTSASFYAPTSAGTSGYVLVSSGSGAPTWSQLNITQDLTSNSAALLTSANWTTLKSAHYFEESSPIMTGLDSTYEFVSIKLSINGNNYIVKLTKNTTNRYSGLFFIEESTNLYELSVYYNGSKLVLRCATVY